MALIYRLSNSPLTGFIDCLRYLVGRNIDILLGDFNIDAFNEPNHKGSEGWKKFFATTI